MYLPSTFSVYVGVPEEEVYLAWRFHWGELLSAPEQNLVLQMRDVTRSHMTEHGVRKRPLSQTFKAQHWRMKATCAFRSPANWGQTTQAPRKLFGSCILPPLQSRDRTKHCCTMSCFRACPHGHE